MQHTLRSMFGLASKTTRSSSSDAKRESSQSSHAQHQQHQQHQQHLQHLQQEQEQQLQAHSTGKHSFTNYPKITTSSPPPLPQKLAKHNASLAGPHQTRELGDENMQDTFVAESTISLSPLSLSPQLQSRDSPTLRRDPSLRPSNLLMADLVGL
ncbi:hypothetical protein BC830DRAFT_1175920 [Chytriomyces sp. MP71]|nr:hypothetical protein BC830DRAFT_1175920 [Chytriomyces sp. MP71]